MKAAGLVIRAGAVLFGLGLFLCLTPLADVAILLLLPVASAIILGGLSATNIKPVILGFVGGAIVVLGVGWTVYYSRTLDLEQASCTGCLPSAPLVDDPVFWLGIFTIALGVAIYVIAAIKSRNARKEHSTSAQPSGTTH